MATPAEMYEAGMALPADAGRSWFARRMAWLRGSGAAPQAMRSFRMAAPAAGTATAKPVPSFWSKLALVALADQVAQTISQAIDYNRAAGQELDSNRFFTEQQREMQGLVPDIVKREGIDPAALRKSLGRTPEPADYFRAVRQKRGLSTQNRPDFTNANPEQDFQLVTGDPFGNKRLDAAATLMAAAGLRDPPEVQGDPAAAPPAAPATFDTTAGAAAPSVPAEHPFWRNIREGRQTSGPQAGQFFDTAANRRADAGLGSRQSIKERRADQREQRRMDHGERMARIGLERAEQARGEAFAREIQRADIKALTETMASDRKLHAETKAAIQTMPAAIRRKFDVLAGKNPENAKRLWSILGAYVQRGAADNMDTETLLKSFESNVLDNRTDFGIE